MSKQKRPVCQHTEEYFIHAADGCKGCEVKIQETFSSPSSWEEEFNALFPKNAYQEGFSDYDLFAIKQFICQLQEQLLHKIITDIEKYDIPYGFGSASGSMMKSAVLAYLKGLQDKKEIDAT